MIFLSISNEVGILFVCLFIIFLSFKTYTRCADSSSSIKSEIQQIISIQIVYRSINLKSHTCKQRLNYAYHKDVNQCLDISLRQWTRKNLIFRLPR